MSDFIMTPEILAARQHNLAEHARQEAEWLRYVSEEEKAALEAALEDIAGWRTRHPLAAALFDERNPQDVLERERRRHDPYAIQDWGKPEWEVTRYDLDPAYLGRYREGVEDDQRRRAEKIAKEARKAARAAKKRGETPAADGATPGKATRVAYLRLVS
jgi:hypothetical protein